MFNYAVLRHGQGGTPCTIICGVVHLGHPAARMLLDALPEIIHIDAAIGRDQWASLPGMLSLMATEARSDRSLAEIAAALGYQSEGAFSRAFKRVTGTAPSHARRRTDLIALGQELAGDGR